ncbi:Uu.00g003320.m01.CDS01 [Anthostomella pinea]|uniref:Uu.00g003320.m01.CDS01 n=1 Tax=Anthostomella pinea TaxID=933095 RepID=A0AAI8VKC9_9PEZI|nr:Uu.00g003320.m01.CDS01 [Anthostomella pinea]
MVLCTLHLISLKDGVSHASFLSKLRQNGIKPLVQARPLRWMILPTQLYAGHLLARNTRWDIFLILESPSDSSVSGGGSIPPSIQASDIAASWTATCGASAKMLAEYRTTNAALLHPAPGSVKAPEAPALDPATSGQNLEMTHETASWIAALPPRLRGHPVSMLNLLAFNPGKKDQYKRYGAEFSKRIGSRHGGRVKIVGRVTATEEDQEAGAREAGWDEIAWVHYPSIEHFAAMAASKDYQEVNREYRLGALKDTFIMCMMEVDDHGEVVDVRAGREKL